MATAERPFAKTLQELADRFDSSSCQECHEEVFDQWGNSMHVLSAYGNGGARTAATYITAWVWKK